MSASEFGAHALEPYHVTAHQQGATPIENALVSVLIPAYNEEATLRRVVERVASLPFAVEIVVVDDCSSDATPEIGEQLAAELDNVRFHRRLRNGGKGAAMQDAIRAASGDIVIVQDADLEYDPVDIPRVIEPLVAGQADVVYGTRLHGGGPQRAHLFSHYVGNKFLSLVARVLYNTTLSDLMTGYKAFRTDLVRSFELEEPDFRFDPEITAKALRTPSVRIYELPISYFGRTFEEGKKITWRVAPAILWVLVRERFTAVTYGQRKWGEHLRDQLAASGAPQA
ncbi:MAG TPA: glycosyltransferase family 2 protein [Conexibacter sp.]|nr:glycosyltransferase family 2 protein [Conexibacter sp.]